MAENGVKYQKVAVRSLVLVHVPNHSDCMRQLDECQFIRNGKPIKIERRWANGMLVDKVIVNRNFYGILSNDLGKNVVAKVEVIKKLCVMAVNSSCWTFLRCLRTNHLSIA